MKELKDEEIRKTIQEFGDSIFLGEDDSERLFQKIRLRTEERRTVMRISRGKKLALALAAVLVIGSVSAIAAGRVASLSSSTDLKEAIQSAEETAREAGSIFGITPDYAEAFENGYQFDRGFVTAVEMADENGVSMGAYPEVQFDYRNPEQAAEEVFLNVANPPEALRAQWDAEGVQKGKKETHCGDITLYTSEDQYLFLPPDETPTEEETALEQEGKLFISYGTETREERVFRSVSWEKNGLHYLLSSYDSGLVVSDLVEMAEAIIK